MSAIVLAPESEDLGVGVMDYRELSDDIESDSGYESAKSLGDEDEIPKPVGDEDEIPKTKGKSKLKTIARGLGLLKKKNSYYEKFTNLEFSQKLNQQKVWGDYHNYNGAQLVFNLLQKQLGSETINLDIFELHSKYETSRLSISDFVKEICHDLNKFIENITQEKKVHLMKSILGRTEKLELSPKIFRISIIENILKNDIDIFLEMKKIEFFKSGNTVKVVDGEEVPERLWDLERFKNKEKIWSDLERYYRSSAITKFNISFNSEMEEDAEYVKNKRNEFEIIEEIRKEDQQQKERIEREQKEKINQMNLEYQINIDKISSKFKFLSTKLDDKKSEHGLASDKYKEEVVEIQMEIIQLERKIKNYKNELLNKKSEYETFKENIKKERKSICSELEETDKEIDDFINNHGYPISTPITIMGIKTEKYLHLNGYKGKVVFSSYRDHLGNLRQQVEVTPIWYDKVLDANGNIVGVRQKFGDNFNCKLKVENLKVDESFLIEFKNQFKK